MNILILNWRDIKHPLAGGAEMSLFEHALYWKRKGAKITWFASHFPGAAKTENLQGIEVMRAGSHFTNVLYAFYFFLRGQFSKYDIVLDCFHFIPYFTPLYMRNKKKIALINEVAGKVWFSNLPIILAWIGFLAEPFFFKFYKNIQFITASESAKGDLLKVGINTSYIRIIHHGVSIEGVNSSIRKEKDPTLLFLNRISKDKGIEDALDAFLLLRKKHVNIKLWIVGKEEVKGYLSNLIKKRNIENLKKNGIEIFGFVSQERKFELLKKAWILVHPSKKEGWGLTVIEAASQKTPTVGYNVEGLKDSIKHMQTGILAAENTLSLTKGIEEIMESKKLYKKLCQESYLWSKAFNWKKSAKESWKILNRTFES